MSVAAWSPQPEMMVSELSGWWSPCVVPCSAYICSKNFAWGWGNNQTYTNHLLSHGNEATTRLLVNFTVVVVWSNSFGDKHLLYFFVLLVEISLFGPVVWVWAGVGIDWMMSKWQINACTNAFFWLKLSLLILTYIPRIHYVIVLQCKFYKSFTHGWVVSQSPGLWGSLNFTVCRPFGDGLRCLPFMIRNLGILPIIILGGPANTGCGDFGDDVSACIRMHSFFLTEISHGRTCLAIMTFTSHSSQAWRLWPVVWVGLNRSWRLYDVRRRVGSQWKSWNPRMVVFHFQCRL